MSIEFTLAYFTDGYLGNVYYPFFYWQGVQVGITTPIRELILQDFVTVLKTIKTPTYRTNVLDANVSRMLKSPAEMGDGDFPVLFVSDGIESIAGKTSRELLNNFTVVITGYIRYNKDASANTEIPSVQINKLIADVKEVVMNTAGVLWTNCNATLILIKTIETDEGFLEPDGVFRMECEVSYEHTHDDAGNV